MIERAKYGADGGQGGPPGTIVRELSTPARRRSTAKMLLAAMDRLPSVTDDPEFWGPIIGAMAAAASDANDARGAAACANVLVRLRGQQIESIALLDKMRRLDGGTPTDRVTFDFESVQPMTRRN